MQMYMRWWPRMAPAQEQSMSFNQMKTLHNILVLSIVYLTNAFRDSWLFFQVESCDKMLSIKVQGVRIQIKISHLNLQLCVPDGLPFCAWAEISLDLSLVHSVQRQHEEDPAHPQSPESMSLSGIWIQAERERKHKRQNIRCHSGHHKRKCVFRYSMYCRVK